MRHLIYCISLFQINALFADLLPPESTKEEKRTDPMSPRFSVAMAPAKEVSQITPPRSLSPASSSNEKRGSQISPARSVSPAPSGVSVMKPLTVATAPPPQPLRNFPSPRGPAAVNVASPFSAPAKPAVNLADVQYLQSNIPVDQLWCTVPFPVLEIPVVILTLFPSQHPRAHSCIAISKTRFPLRA